MARYQVVYSKNKPMSVWCDTVAQAEEKSKMLQASGYSVAIWEHDVKGAHPYGKTLLEAFGA